MIRPSKRTVLVLGAATAAIVSFGIVFTTILSTSSNSLEKLKLATRWLDAGRWDLAGRFALEIESALDGRDEATWHYVRGVSQLIRIMEDLDSYQNRLILFDVTRHLEKSREQGFPLGYQGKAFYYLGVCRFYTYRWEEAIEALENSLSLHPEARSDSFRMIVTAHLRKPVPNPDLAEEVLERWEALPGLSAREIAQTHLAHAQVALHRNQLEDCSAWLSRVPLEVPEHYEAQKWKALCFLHTASLPQTKGPDLQRLLAEAHAILEKLILAAETPFQIRRQAFFLTGKILRNLGLFQKAVSVLSGVRQQSPFSAEAIAAGLEEAEILMDLARYSEVPSTTEQILSSIRDIRLYNEYWVSVDELRTRLLEIGNRLRQLGKYEMALELADQLILAFPPSHALRLQANTFVNWGTSIERESDPEDAQARRVVHDLFARAGDRFERLSRMELRSRDYLNLVWSAVENYNKAGKIDDANRMLEDYLKYEQRPKRPRALLAMGKNLIRLGRWESSLIPLRQCLTEFPASPSSYEARFLAAQALAEMDDIEQAIEYLSENLWDYELHPDSPIWKESFIELGNLRFRKGQRILVTESAASRTSWNEIQSRLQRSQEELLAAAHHLHEACRRYPEDHRRNHLRYQLGRAYQMAAELPRQTLRNDPSLSEVARTHLSQQKVDLLESAAESYATARRSLLAQRDNDQLSSLDGSILRNAFFGEAQVLAELGRYPEAIEVYRAAAGHYISRPESLEALAQVAECFRKLGQHEDAERTIRQAELVLQRIPADRDEIFVTTTRGDRRHWESALGQLKNWN